MSLFLVNLDVDPIVRALGLEKLAEINFLSIIVRIILAILVGGVIGIDRSKKKHAAGLRTYILVSLGATLAGFTNQFIIEFFGSGDGARLGAQVISGIGFLCAGTIIVTSRSQIKGLTTAAGLWAVGCLGLSIGLGFYTLAIVGTIIIILTLIALVPIEARLVDKSKVFTLFVELDARVNLKDLITYLRNNNFQISNVEHNIAYASSGLSVYTLVVTSKAKEFISHEAIINNISSLPYVSHAEIIRT